MCYKFSLLFIADFKRNVRFLILEECKSIKRITIVHIVTKVIFEMHFFFFFPFFFLGKFVTILGGGSIARMTARKISGVGIGSERRAI